MYKLTPTHPVYGESQIVIRLSDMAYVPMVEDNRDYQTYLKWLDGYELIDGQWQKTSESNTPEPADELPQE